MGFRHLIYEMDSDGIVTIRFNNPERLNAMTAEMGDELAEAAGKVAAEENARVVVLTGEGRAFSAGGDMDMIEANTRRSALVNQKEMRAFYGRFLTIRDIPVPTIASINGHAIGAGLCVALACDIRLANEQAKMAVNFTALGLHPGMGGTWILPRVAGLPAAAEMLFSSRRIDGREAERIGLVSHAYPAEELHKKTLELAREIAACGPVAVRLTKRALSRSLQSTLSEQLDFEALQQALTFETEDVREGVKAVREKRGPRFEGR